MGGPWEWALIRGWAHIKLSPFSAISVVFLFCNKTVNAVTNREEVTKQGLCKILRSSSGKSLISTLQFQFQYHYHSSRWSGGGRFFEFNWEGEGWSGRLFEAGRLLTFSGFRMSAYSRKAPIRGWVPIRVNTVFISGRYFSGGEQRRSEIRRLVAWGKNGQEKKTSSERAWAYWQRIVCTKKRAMTSTRCTAAPFPQVCGRNVAINIKGTIVRRTMKLNPL